MAYNFIKKEYGIWGYPTVFDFDVINDREAYNSHFLNTEIKDQIKIYIHIPFCVTRCLFCPFYKERYNSMTPEQVEECFQMLWKEIVMYSHLMKTKPQVFSVYFGGGDPACVDAKYIEKTIQYLNDCFDLSNCEEIIMEGNAKSLNDLEKLSIYKEAKVNRISFGVQIFDPQIRKKVALRPSVDDIYETIDSLHKVGIPRIDIDMMYNLPDQTAESLEKDLEIAFRLPLTYVSYYQLTVMPNTQFENLLKKDTYTTNPPSPEKDMELSKVIMDKAEKMGMYEPRYMCFSDGENSRRDEELEKNCLPVLAFGPSAKGTFYDINYKNVSSIQQYVDVLKNDMFPAINCYYASKEDMEVFQLLMALQTMRFKKSQITGYDRFDSIFRDLIESGYVAENGEELSLTRAGKVFIGNIQYLFINHDQKKRRYRNVLKSRNNKTNPYNQDKMDIK
jgi:oxygen-independent coproporphyrinogen-3 oxidase